ncbi:MAG: hypothetical protein JWO52_276 [Gammaproteobacteria bacterium]|nr:hypothetical protein [Gammaproteobacteria bacterium]
MAPVPDIQAPGVPTGLASSGITSSSVVVTWNSSSDNVGVSGYKIYRGGVQAGTTSGTSFTDSGLTASTTYSYTVAAFDASGNTSAQSAPASATTLAVSSAAISVTAAFDGVSGPAYSDHPDLGGAVGPSHVVDFVGASFTVHDKSTGAILRQLTQTQFWTNAGVSPGTLLDPRLVYDPLAGRWYGVNAGPYAFLAVSAGSDPTGAWQGVTLSTAVSGDLLVKVAFDANGVYVCHYGGNTNAVCYAIPKVDLLWGAQLAAPTLARMATFTNLAFELVPAIDLDPGKPVTAAEALLTRQGSQNATNLPMVLILNEITWSGGGCLTLNASCTASMSGAQTIGTHFTYTTPGNATQPGSAPPIRGVENHRFMDVFASGGSVFAAQGSEIGGRVGFNWFEVRVSDGTLVQQGQLADPDYDVLFPTLAADANGNIGIGFTKISATEFPSVYLSGRLAGDPLNTLMTPVLATSGSAGYSCPPTSPVGWGTYSSTMQDPSNPLTLWTYQEYANSATACHWSTRWVAFSL